MCINGCWLVVLLCFCCAQVQPGGSSVFLEDDLPWPKAPEVIGTVFPGVSTTASAQLCSPTLILSLGS